MREHPLSVGPALDMVRGRGEEERERGSTSLAQHSSSAIHQRSDPVITPRLPPPCRSSPPTQTRPSPPPPLQVISSYTDAPLPSRLGAASALLKAAPLLGDAEVTLSLDFLIRNGLADNNDKVRQGVPGGEGGQGVPGGEGGQQTMAE